MVRISPHTKFILASFLLYLLWCHPQGKMLGISFRCDDWRRYLALWVYSHVRNKGNKNKAVNRKLHCSDNRPINYEWSYTLMNNVFPESFCVNIFPSKANLLNECHSDCSCLSKKRRKERKGKKKIKCTYIKYAYNIFFKFFKIPKEKLKLQEQSDSWKMKHSSITLCQSKGPYTGKAKSY